jgi:deoxyadenosine/deoxycytidine kinase
LFGLAAAGSLSREDVKKLLYLRGWDRVLRRQAQAGQQVVLDQGPIFKLAALYEFGSDDLRRNYRWWPSMLDRWAQIIDWVVRLDGPNEVLIDRINSRDKSHEIKAIDKSTMCSYLDRYRCSYDYVISEIRSRGSADILSFDTIEASPQQIVSKILEAIV